MDTTKITLILSLWLAQSLSQNMNGGYIEGLLKFIQEGTTYLREEPPDQMSILSEYDFVIVGAGAAGSVLANRLTQIREWKVLLLEAGGTENYIMDVPILTTWFQFTEVNWKYKTVPSNNVCLSMENRQCSYPRGKVMGGSTSINYMIYTRGHRRNYDEWEEMGNDGWSYKDILPYFRQIEDMTIPEMAVDKKYHSTGGEVTISYAPYRTPLADAFVQAGAELGYRIIDYNGETQTGFSYLQSLTRNGTRLSASRAFLHPIKQRTNFHVKKRSLVTKIMIDPRTKTAYGVEFIRGSKKYFVRAKKEVILSGGAINSPQLLMLSGIGPKKHLNEMNIPVIQDLKVGYNLMDHPGMITGTFVINQSVAIVTEDVLNDGRALYDFSHFHSGPLSVPAACEGIAFLDSNNLTNPDGDPNIEFLFFGGGIPSELTYYKVVGLSDKFYRNVYKHIEGAHTWTIVPLVVRPKSRGRVMLSSVNPYKKPLIYHDFYENPQDLEDELFAIKKMMELSKTSAFQKFGSKINDIPIPGCEQHKFGSDDYWRCAARHTSTGIWHLSGTCKMGPYWDPNAVVDPRLRVYGVKGLRVVDASIMPMIPAAHTTFPTMMIGAKAADLIKQDWGRR
ncbi:glucose dehydrogenase [FAD, quinone]-like isoform X2 [Periplaneta americana]|uniref:glucose dehydrogenase [FAD, quinone]-like isoform X2 n=1 Tax=Periplaneta americana TaxID=6978 RepID=UPI0037E869BF